MREAALQLTETQQHIEDIFFKSNDLQREVFNTKQQLAAQEDRQRAVEAHAECMMPLS